MIKMSSLEEARTQFYTALEGLKEVHTRKELDIQRKMVENAKNRLLIVDPEFKLMIEENKRRIKIEFDKIGAEYSAKISELESKFSFVRAKAEATRREAEKQIDDWVNAKIVKKISFKNEDAFNKTKLICPICKASDRGNSINGVPTCMSCFHKLVTKSELRKYNRDYRRKWKRKRGKMV